MQQANAIEVAIDEAKKMRDEYKQRGDNGPGLWHHYREMNCLEELIERLEGIPQPSYSQGGTGGTGGPNTFPIYKKLAQEAIASIEALPRITK